MVSIFSGDATKGGTEGVRPVRPPVFGRALVIIVILADADPGAYDPKLYGDEGEAVKDKQHVPLKLPLPEAPVRSQDLHKLFARAKV